ncbi:hypothetical protein BJ138DRAFT_636184 [Hygrophoropsis aurantiaca]|uniref:Uncharacterized protein n=1 Tax=Hygrophoropsis aurantiaca TaxID=72124 RepID=A0ACB8A0B4_9AGAM|nr:hypothetical protein BJ138DRAFT_636184 [Hygrophoropsis aurantiaca]
MMLPWVSSKTVITTVLMATTITASAVPQPQVEEKSAASSAGATLRLFSELNFHGKENTFHADKKHPMKCFHLYNGMKTFKSAELIGKQYHFTFFNNSKCAFGDSFGLGTGGGESYKDVVKDLYEPALWSNAAAKSFKPSSFQINDV